MENQAKSTTGIVTSYGKITVDEVKDHKYKSDRKQAQLRQEITTTYPGARANNSKTDSLFGEEDFGFKGGQDYIEKRVTWIDVPTTATEDMVLANLAKFPDARLQKHMSNSPILTDEEQYAVDNGITQRDGTIVPGSEIYDRIERRQRVRNADEELIDINGEFIYEDSEGNVALEDHNRIQYRAIYFRNTAVADIDNRTQPKKDRVVVAKTAEQAVEAAKATATADKQ